MPLPEALRGRPMPDKRRILADLWSLIEQDWRNIEAGITRRPDDGLGNPFEAMRRAVDFFADLSAVERTAARRARGASSDAKCRPAATRAITCRNSTFRATAI